MVKQGPQQGQGRGGARRQAGAARPGGWRTVPRREPCVRPPSWAQAGGANGPGEGGDPRATETNGLEPCHSYFSHCASGHEHSSNAGFSRLFYADVPNLIPSQARRPRHWCTRYNYSRTGYCQFGSGMTSGAVKSYTGQGGGLKPPCGSPQTSRHSTMARGPSHSAQGNGEWGTGDTHSTIRGREGRQPGSAGEETTRQENKERTRETGERGGEASQQHRGGKMGR